MSKKMYVLDPAGSVIWGTKALTIKLQSPTVTVGIAASFARIEMVKTSGGKG